MPEPRPLPTDNPELAESLRAQRSRDGLRHAIEGWLTPAKDQKQDGAK